MNVISSRIIKFQRYSRAFLNTGESLLISSYINAETDENIEQYKLKMAQLARISPTTLFILLTAIIVIIDACNAQCSCGYCSSKSPTPPERWVRLSKRHSKKLGKHIESSLRGFFGEDVSIEHMLYAFSRNAKGT